MKKLLVLLVLGALVAPGFATPAEFAKIKKGSRVRIVLANSDQCEGKVTERNGTQLAVKLAQDSRCGTAGALVTVRAANTTRVEKNPASARRNIGGLAAGVAAGVALLASCSAIGQPNVVVDSVVVFGALVAIPAVALHVVHQGSGYTLYVSTLG